MSNESEAADESDSDESETCSDSDSEDLCDSDLEDDEENPESENFEQGINRLCGVVAYEMRNVDASLRSDSEPSRACHSKHVDRIYSGQLIMHSIF